MSTEKKMSMKQSFLAASRFVGTHAHVELPKDDISILASGMLLLPDGAPADLATWSDWLESVVNTAGKKVRPLFQQHLTDDCVQISDVASIDFSHWKQAVLHMIGAYSKRISSDEINDFLVRLQRDTKFREILNAHMQSIFDEVASNDAALDGDVLVFH